MGGSSWAISQPRSRVWVARAVMKPWTDRWQAAVVQRWAMSGGRLVQDEETGEPFRVPCCPDCTAQIVDKDGVPLTVNNDNYFCRRVASSKLLPKRSYCLT